MSSVFETESNDSFTLANSVSLGNTVTGALSSSSDRDYYKVTTTSSGVLQFSVTAPQLSNWAYAVQVYDSSHKLLGAAYLGYVTSTTFSIGALNPGTYYVSVGNSNTYSNQSYTITPTFVAADARNYETESNDTRSIANAVSLDRAISGQMSSGSDIDCYSIDVAKAGLFSVDFKAPVSVNHDDYLVSIYDPTGKLIDKQTTGMAMSFVEDAAVAGKYVVQVERATNGSYQSGNYSFVAHAEGSALPVAKATLPASGPTSGTLSSAGQADWYRVNLNAGQLYEFAVAGAQSGAGTLTSASLVLTDAAGNVLEQSAAMPTYGSGTTVLTADPRIAFTAATTGAYFLRVAGYGTTGTYSIGQQNDSLDALLPALTGTPGERWTGGGTQKLVLSYGFLTSGANGQTGFVAMNDVQKQAVRTVLAQYASFLNIDFVEASDPAKAQIGYGTSDQHNVSGGVEYSTYNADGTLSHANVYLNNTASSNGAAAEASNLTSGSYGFETLVHETGHALGLKHPGNYDSLNGSGEAPFMPAAWDNRKYTVMSYIDDPENAASEQTPGLLDIAALQSMYGVRSSATPETIKIANGFTGAVLSGSSAATLDLSGLTTACTISLTPGTFSSVGTQADGTAAHDNLAIPFSLGVRQLLAGSGDDVIVGSRNGGVAANGGAGNDLFTGFAGKSAAIGGAGTDTLALNAAAGSVHIVKLRDNTIVVNDGQGGVTLCRDVEQIQCADQTLSVASIGTSSIDAILTEVYVSAFRRAPETEGYNYWMQQKAQFGMASVANTIFSLDIVKAIYPVAMSATDFVTAIYQNVFNRAPDSTGLNYWTTQLAGTSRGQVVMDMSYSALNAPDGTAGKDFFQNRIDSALYAVGYQASHGPVSATHLSDLMGTVSDDAVTVATLVGQAELGQGL